MSGTNPFQPSKEQVAAKVATDARIASLQLQDPPMLAKIAEFEAQADEARRAIAQYNLTVIEPKRHELLRLIQERRPLESELNRIKYLAMVWRRRRMRLMGKRAARISKIAQALEQKNLEAQQKQLIKVFRKRRSMSRPDFAQSTPTCESSNTQTGTTMPDTSPSTDTVK